MNGGNDIMLSITHDTQEDLYDYVDQNITPVFEQLSTVAQVESMGGSSEYVKVELDPVKMKQYKVTVNQITSAMAASDLSYPSGSAEYGDLSLSVTTSAKAGTLNDLKRFRSRPRAEKSSIWKILPTCTPRKNRWAVCPAITDRRPSPSPYRRSRTAPP